MGPLNHKLVDEICREHKVTPEHLRDVIRRRRLYRRGRKNRLRKRRAILKLNPKAKRNPMAYKPGGEVYLLAGEGELHGLLKATGLTAPEFYKLVGIDQSVFCRWYGHPLHPWPVEFLRYYGRAQAMGRYLEAQGVDLQQFEPKLPPPLAAPDFPRPAPKGKSQAIPPPVEREYSPWLKRS